MAAANELARALLRAGADPNDGQTSYSNGPVGTAPEDPTHLKRRELTSWQLATDADHTDELAVVAEAGASGSDSPQ